MPVAKNIAERLRKKREEKNKPFKAGEGRIIDPTKEASGRDPIQRKLTRKQKIDQLKPLQESAKRAGVDTGSRAARRDAGGDLVAPPARPGVRTDLDRLADVRETLGSETQAPLEVQLQLRDVARELDRQRLAERKKVGSGLLQQQIEGKGIPQGAVSLDDQGQVVVNVGAALGNVSMERFIKNNKPGFRFRGQLSTDPEIAELQKHVAQAQFTGSANIGTLQDNLRKAILGKVGRTDFREVALDPEFEQRLAAEQKQAEFLAARTVGSQPELTQSGFNQKIAAFQAERRETLKQADLLKQEEGIEFDNERRRQRQIAEARIDTASPAVRAAVKAQAFKNIDDKINKRRDERFEEIDASVDKAIKGIEGDEAEARAEALENAQDPTKELARRKALEKQAFINKKIEEGMSVTEAELVYNAEIKAKQKALAGDDTLEVAVDDTKALLTSGAISQDDVFTSLLNHESINGDTDKAEKALDAMLVPAKEKKRLIRDYQKEVLGYSDEVLDTIEKEKTFKERLKLANAGKLSEEEEEALEQELILDGKTKTAFAFRYLQSHPDADAAEVTRAWKKQSALPKAAKGTKRKGDFDATSYADVEAEVGDRVLNGEFDDDVIDLETALAEDYNLTQREEKRMLNKFSKYDPQERERVIKQSKTFHGTVKKMRESGEIDPGVAELLHTETDKAVTDLPPSEQIEVYKDLTERLKTEASAVGIGAQIGTLAPTPPAAEALGRRVREIEGEGDLGADASEEEVDVTDDEINSIFE